MAGSLSASVGYFAVKAEVSVEASGSSKSSTQSHMVVANMRIERYYASVSEDQSPLAPDAIALLEAQDYVGFFKACGPNYVRSIRRVQELMAIFKFTSTSTEMARQFSAGLQVSSPFGSAESKVEAKSKFNSSKSSLSIKILGFGLGLNQEGSDSLVATTMGDYQAVLSFAFKSATQNEDSHNIGMVYGMEVVPWVNNVSFQVNAKVLDDVVTIKVPRSLIPKAIQITDPSVKWTTGSTREEFTCKEPSFRFDKFGYCCESTYLFDQTAGTYDPTIDPSTAICKPIRELDKGLVKENMASNGEFVARMDAAMRYRLAIMAQLEFCIGATRALPSPTFDYHILKAQDSVRYDAAITVDITLLQLKKAIDPLGDYGLMKQMARELDEWIKMFYSPCIAAIYGTNEGTDPGVDENYFKAYPWYEHQECTHLSCLSNAMRWDRVNGGCTTGIVTGVGATEYGADDAETYCSSDVDVTDSWTCEYTPAFMREVRDNMVTCWTDLALPGDVLYMVNNYCAPQLTGLTVDEDTIADLATKTENCRPPSS